MKFGNTPESHHFLDFSGLPKMLTMLFDTQNRNELEMNRKLSGEEGPEGGYSNWITHWMNSLQPEEYQAMKGGATLEDIMYARALAKGRAYVDPSVPIYRKK